MVIRIFLKNLKISIIPEKSFDKVDIDDSEKDLKPRESNGV